MSCGSNSAVSAAEQLSRQMCVRVVGSVLSRAPRASLHSDSDTRTNSAILFCFPGVRRTSCCFVLELSARSSLQISTPSSRRRRTSASHTYSDYASALEHTQDDCRKQQCRRRELHTPQTNIIRTCHSHQHHPTDQLLCPPFWVAQRSSPNQRRRQRRSRRRSAWLLSGPTIL